MKMNTKKPPRRKPGRKLKSRPKRKKRPIVRKVEEQTLQDMIVEAKAGGKTRDHRLEFVTKLLVRRYKRFEIVRLVGEIYEVKFSAVDKDIADARDQFVEWYQKQKAKDLRAESEATMDEAIHVAFRKGDVNAVVQAQKHKDTVTRIVKDDETPATKLGVVVLHAKEKDAKTWASKYSKLKPAKK